MYWYEWALSIVGTILTTCAGLAYNNSKKSQKQVQKVGKNSVAIQSVRDTNIKL